MGPKKQPSLNSTYSNAICLDLTDSNWFIASTGFLGVWGGVGTAYPNHPQSLWPSTKRPIITFCYFNISTYIFFRNPKEFCELALAPVMLYICLTKSKSPSFQLRINSTKLKKETSQVVF